MDEMSAAQTWWTRLMLGPCKREACIEDQRGHAPAGPVCAICGPGRSSTHCEPWSDSLGAPARYSWAFASESCMTALLTPHSSRPCAGRQNLSNKRPLFLLLVQKPFLGRKSPENSCKKSKAGSCSSREFSSGRNRRFLFECARWSGMRLTTASPSQKKPRGQALSVGDHLLNHLVSKARVVVENVLAGVQTGSECPRCLAPDDRWYCGAGSGDCVRVAYSPRQLSSPASPMRCAELCQCWFNPLMSLIHHLVFLGEHRLVVEWHV